jgi:hypothetical protein
MLKDLSDWASLEEGFYYGYSKGLNTRHNIEGILTMGRAFSSRIVLYKEGEKGREE